MVAAILSMEHSQPLLDRSCHRILTHQASEAAKGKKKRFFFVCFQEILFIYDFIQVALGTIDSHLENGNHSHEGYAVAQLVEALHYKSEGCRFDSQ